MNFKITFEDDQILVIDKAAGIIVNRAQTVKGPTLEDLLCQYFKKTLPQVDSNIGDRAGIVHRLDRETSGLLIVAKTQKAFENLQNQFKTRTVQKEYIALVHGIISDQTGSISSKIARVGKFGKFGVVDSLSTRGRESQTNFKVEKYLHHLSLEVQPLKEVAQLTKSRIRYLRNHAVDYTLLRVFPKTGRTHQIRVHLKSIGHPVVSDTLYAPAKLIKFDLLWCPRLFLHASRLEIIHPTSKKVLEFKSDLPKDLKNAMLNLTANG